MKDEKLQGKFNFLNLLLQWKLQGKFNFLNLLLQYCIYCENVIFWWKEKDP